MEVLHESIDGSLVSIRAQSGVRISRPSSVGVFAMGGRWQEFTASDQDGGRAVADALGIDLTETLTYERGSLSLGTKVSRDTWPEGGTRTSIKHFGLWEGEHTSVHAHHYNGRVQDLVAIFEAVTLTEDPNGVRVIPKDRKRVTLAKEPSLLQEISGIGLLIIRPLTRSLARRLPRWSGTQTSGGELFVGKRPGSVHFVLVGQRSVTQIMPDGTDCNKDMPNIASLQVTWEPGSLVTSAM